LLVTKYEIDPVMYHHGDILALKSLAVNSDEIVWVPISPLRQLYIMDSLFLLSQPKVVELQIYEKLWHIKKFRTEFTHVRHFVGSTPPAPHQAIEYSIGYIESTTL
jgi:hypothetical protein